MVNEGFGRHQFYLMQDPRQFVRAMKWQVVWQPTFIVSVILTRISICLFYLRIFTTNPRWRWALYSIVAFILITNFPSFIIVFVQCKPFEKAWNSTLPGNCWPLGVGRKIGLYNGIISVIIDWLLASLPVVFLWDVQLNRKTKAGICALMGMGFFTGICAIVRTVMFARASSAGKAADFSWTTIDLRVWGTLENQVGIIAACIPTVKPLYVQATSSVYTSWSRGKSSKGYAAQSDDQLHQLKPVHAKSQPHADQRAMTLRHMVMATRRSRELRFPWRSSMSGDP